MNEQQAENLRILIRHMETKCDRILDMVAVSRCGTPACALGEAKLICMPEMFSGSLNTYVRASEVFGLPYESGVSPGNHRIFRLFGAELHGKRYVEPQEWAAEARKVLAEHGYSMDDGFAAFKERLLNKPYEEPKWRDNGGLEMLHEYDRAQHGE